MTNTTPDYAGAGAVFSVNADTLMAGLNIRVGPMQNEYGVTRVLVDVCYSYCSAGDVGDAMWNRSVPVRFVFSEESRDRLGRKGAYTWAVDRRAVDAAITDLKHIHGDIPVTYQVPDWRFDLAERTAR